MPHFVAIESPDDPRVAEYSLVRDRDLAGRDGAFLVESEVVVRVLLARGRFRVRSLLLEARRRAKLEDALAALPDDVPVYVMPQSAMDRLVGFPIHRGVLAMAERGAPLDPAALLAPPGPRLVVGLAGISNHDNVGGIFRSAAAFGADAVLVDSLTCDPLYRKAVRVSVGGVLVVPFARVESEDALIRSCESNDFQVFSLTPRGEIDLRELAARPPARAALLVGAEGPGLSEAVLARTQRVRIHMAGTMDSLNVATAASIALHALQKLAS